MGCKCMSKLSKFIGIDEGVEFKFIGNDNVFLKNAIFKIGEAELLIKLKNNDNWHTANININEVLELVPIPLPKKILTDTERDYLRAVIKPVKNKVTKIVKVSVRDAEFIKVGLANGDCISLYLFEKNTQFKNMIADKFYTLDEINMEEQI